MRRTTLGLALILLLAGANARGGDAKKDKEKLQGTWMLTSMEVGGKAVPLPKDAKLIFAGDKLTATGGPMGDEHATYKLDAGKKPRQIDLIEKKDGKDGKTIQGIYSIEGDTLKLAFAVEAEKGPRPTAFEGKEVGVMTLKRVKS
jgi:uncharacterized protein (TIGR03067 family)